ncbi:hypothetical protein SNE40_022608 [Patella caerulea]|uniref:Uncharacterized protein n=1 Tax=Patella caerulea TaxID=87958 RepID=A0AAN8GFV9_PATCE
MKVAVFFLMVASVLIRCHGQILSTMSEMSGGPMMAPSPMMGNPMSRLLMPMVLSGNSEMRKVMLMSMLGQSRRLRGLLPFFALNGGMPDGFAPLAMMMSQGGSMNPMAMSVMMGGNDALKKMIPLILIQQQARAVAAARAGQLAAAAGPMATSVGETSGQM